MNRLNSRHELEISSPSLPEYIPETLDWLCHSSISITFIIALCRILDQTRWVTVYLGSEKMLHQNPWILLAM